jgi:hypothetical protein
MMMGIRGMGSGWDVGVMEYWSGEVAWWIDGLMDWWDGDLLQQSNHPTIQ